ncbi:MAG: hypothetical protein FD133_1743 [Erysipelotrichaceae bacterium]|nr:MAG: hypothetical protein FD179_781 [Erysipelotrichaceae bacterium]TXT16619.1 MAG: hypothetical protein FD133_1743 [Erysipelotrichaceae bacterium]
MLNIKEKFKLKSMPIINMPDYLKSELTPFNSLTLQNKQEALLVFTQSNDEFFKTLEDIIKQDLIEDKGILLICYPKKGSPLYRSTVHRDEIFPRVKMDEEGFVYGSPYRFNRMLGFDENFTLLEIKKVLNFKPKSKISQIGSDYVHHIPELEALLEDEPLALKFYKSLTPGYRKDWAVYVFSTNSTNTRRKRIEEMIYLLKLGHKNITLYRQSLKKKPSHEKP